MGRPPTVGAMLTTMPSRRRAVALHRMGLQASSDDHLPADALSRRPARRPLRDAIRKRRHRLPTSITAHARRAHRDGAVGRCQERARPVRDPAEGQRPDRPAEQPASRATRGTRSGHRGQKRDPAASAAHPLLRRRPGHGAASRAGEHRSRRVRFRTGVLGLRVPRERRRDTARGRSHRAATKPANPCRHRRRQPRLPDGADQLCRLLENGPRTS